MDMQGYINEVTLKLTGNVLSMELSETTLTSLINSSLRELQRYIDTTKLITIPFENCIDVKPYKVNSVARIYRSEGYMGNVQSSETGIVVPARPSSTASTKPAAPQPLGPAAF